MKRIFALGILSAVVAAPMVSAQVVIESPNKVVATVNGTDITAGQLILLRLNLPQQYQTIGDEQLYDGLLQQVIEQELLRQYLGEPPQHIRWAAENEARNLAANEAMANIAFEAVNEDAIVALYNEKFADHEASREFHAAHILVETEEEATEILTRLNEGAEFAAMARQYSIGPSAPGGGDLDWFPLGRMVPEFEEAVVALEVGEMSGPVQTQFGWHLIKLYDTRLSAAPPIEDIQQQLIEEIQQRAIALKLTDLNAEAEIEKIITQQVDPSFMSNTDLLFEE
ncbi:MAG: peptidylprolyl isomerase [Mangrovicoccus sp.]